MKPKLAIITTHPIQYNAPWFRLLAQRGKIIIRVFYTWSQVEKEEKFDPGFGKNVQWDIPLLEGYDYTFVKNISEQPGSKSYKGIRNPSLIKEVTDWGADAVLIFGWKFNSHLKAIKYFHKKIPVLFRGDSTLLDTISAWKNWVRRIVLKTVFKRIDYALYVGEANKQYFLDAGMSSSKLVFVPHAVDNKRFGNSVSLTSDGMSGLKNDKFTLLFAGKLEKKKDPELLLRAVKNYFPDVQLLIVGDGPQASLLQSQYGDEENIRFLGFQNQKVMPDIYRKADVFVLPSAGPGETWGLAVNEAMASGTPVLVSNKCGCAQDLIEGKTTGMVFKSGDEKSLQESIAWFIQNKDKLKLMGSSAIEKIKDWSFEKIVESLEGLVLKIRLNNG